MKKYRYGKFKIKDHTKAFIIMTVFLFFSAMNAILDLPLLFVLFPLMYVVIWLVVLYLPFREQFIINKTCIDVYKGKKKDTIQLPNDLTLIISPLDVCPPLATRTAIQKQTYILKERYAVSILTDVTIEKAMEALHRNYIKQYTSSTIKAVFNDWHYIYSFILDSSDMLERIITDRKCAIIIPKSLFNEIDVDKYNINLYIDEQC